MGTGRITRLIKDKGRSDLYSGEDIRRIPISIYYPTKEEGDSLYKDLYYPKTEMLEKIYAEGKHERRERLNNLRADFINGAEPDINFKKMPVIVFSHGLSADRDFYMFLVSYLARKGYFIVTTGHLYDTDFTLLPDGNVIEMKEGLLGESSTEERRKQIRFRSGDLKFVLDYLPELNREFDDMLDLTRVAAIGHSLGAMTVLYSMSHSTLKSGILLDAPIALTEDDVIKVLSRNGKRILSIRRQGIDYCERIRKAIEEGASKSDQNFKKSVTSEHERALVEGKVTLDLFKATGKHEEYFLEMDGTDHLTFTDWYYLLSDILPPENEPIEVSHMKLQAVSEVFLEETLNGKEGIFRDLIMSGKLPGVHVENTVRRL